MLLLVPSKIFLTGYQSKTKMVKKTKKNKVCMFVRNNCQSDSRVLREAKTLIEANFKVKIIAISEGQQEKIQEIKDGIEIKRIIIPINGPKPLPLIQYWLESFWEAFREEFDFYYAHDLDTLLPAFLVAKIKRKKIIYDSHELYIEAGRSNLAKFCWMILESFLVKFCDKVITVNESIAQEISKRYKISLPKIIRNFPDVDKDWRPKRFNLFYQKFGIPHKIPIILYYGGLRENRGLENLIEAAKHIKKGLVVLMGDDKLKETLKKRIKENSLESKVIFSPPVPQKELIFWVASADIGVIPYLGNELNNYYCLPNKLFELIVAGVPIVANDLPELRKVIQNEKVGLLCEAQNPKSIAEAINKLLEDSNKLQEIKNNIIVCYKKYLWINEKNKFLEIFK